MNIPGYTIERELGNGGMSTVFLAEQESLGRKVALKVMALDPENKQAEDGITTIGSSTHPVARKRLNGLGLYDMSGNVWEWCQDRFNDDYYGKSPRNNPRGPLSCTIRVGRGGGWFGNPGHVRTAARGRSASDGRSSAIGFRLAMSAGQ